MFTLEKYFFFLNEYSSDSCRELLFIPFDSRLRLAPRMEERLPDTGMSTRWCRRIFLKDSWSSNISARPSALSSHRRIMLPPLMLLLLTIQAHPQFLLAKPSSLAAPFSAPDMPGRHRQSPFHGNFVPTLIPRVRQPRQRFSGAV